MSAFLLAATEFSVTLIDTMALVIILFGTIEAFYSGVVLALSRNDTGTERRDIWLRYARWLVAALTFQLAADILETSIAPDLETVGRLAAIAVIRTLLNYFLEKDLSEIRERQTERRTVRTAKGAK
jgi:uncharacterized membrane protein